MSAHTPGPWRVAPAWLYCGDDINVDAGTTGYIATCGKLGDETAAANARLICSAPDLLAALSSIVEWNSRNLDGPDDAGRGVTKAQLDAASAAIAKAMRA